VLLRPPPCTAATGFERRVVVAGPRSKRYFATAPTLTARYSELLATGEVLPDPRQELVVSKLQALAGRLEGYTPPAPAAAPRPQRNRRVFDSLSGAAFSLFGGAGAQAEEPKPAAAKRLPPGVERGLYVWGGCGCGKTFLMDLFFESLPVARKRRVHFHEWMLEVHKRLHQLQKANAMVKEKAQATWTAEAATSQRQALKAQGFNGSHGKTSGGAAGADDLMIRVADEMFQEAWLLCFDEFQVTHISDAIIMKRLFSILFERGAVVVATSNRPPSDLYLNGLNRELFAPFIPMLLQRCEVHAMGAEVDYRLVTTAEEDDRRVYITPLGPSATELLESKLHRMCRGGLHTDSTIEMQGRRLTVPRCGRSTKVGFFTFKDLCDKPLGAADYFAIADAFHTVFIADIPQLTLQERDQVRRLITLVDCLYERHTKLVCTADAQALELFKVTEQEAQGTFDEIFAWDRTASRLQEMQSTEYLTEWSRQLEHDQYLRQFELCALDEGDAADLWLRYGGGEGEIGTAELRRVLEDVLEATQGHRHVSDELFKVCLTDLDVPESGTVSRSKFEACVRRHGIVFSWSQQRSEELQRSVDEAFARMGGALAGLPFSFTLADPTLEDCPLIGCSAGFIDLTGYSLHEIVGRSCRFLLAGVPQGLISARMRTRAHEFCAAVMAGNRYKPNKEQCEHWLPETPEGEALIVQTNARKDGSLFLNLFLMRQVVIETRPFILAVQTGADAMLMSSVSSLAEADLPMDDEEARGEACQQLLTDLVEGAPLAPEDAASCRQAVQQLRQHMDSVERLLAGLVPRLQRRLAELAA